MPLSRYGGVFQPDDLAILQRVFDRLCKKRRLALKDKQQRNDLAGQVVSMFQQGVMDETELLRAVSKHRRS